MSGWGRGRRLRRAICALALLTLAAPALAAEPGPACQLKQLAAAKALYRDSLRCWAKDPNRDPFETLQCLARPEERFAAIYARAAQRALERGGECGLKIRLEALLLRAALDVDGLNEDLVAGLDRANADDRKLRAKLLKAAAGFAARAFAAERRHVASPDAPRRERSYAEARTRLSTAFARASARALERGVAYAGPDANEVADRLASAAAYWAALTRSDRASYGVAGTVFASESTFVDSDVNDISTNPVFNGSFDAAQVLPAPSMLGGYVNLPGRGAFGNLYDSGDRFDTYAVHLAAGQVVVLVLGNDPSEVDLDFCVYGEAFPPPQHRACSLLTEPVELVPIPADGEYFIDVFPYEGCNCGSNYVLAIAQTMPAAALRAARSDVDFVPGELIVRMKGEPLAGAAAARRPAASELALEAVAGDPSRELLMRLPKNAAARASAFNTLGAKGAHDALLARAGSLSPEEQLRQETVLALKTLKRRPDVASAELNTIAKPALVPVDPLYTLQWHYPMIRLPQAWDATTGDPDVIVAVVDTGVVLSHPDLQGQLIAGYDFISSASRARDGNGIDPNPDDPGDLAFGPGASSFHGTHVAGTVGAASDNALGVAGVAWGARVMPVRVLGVQGGTIYDILQGVRFAAGLPNDSGTVPAQPADVINLSLTGGGFSQLAQDVFGQARAAGVVVVAAAGNEATNAPAFPASYDGVISVSAVDLNQRRALYSNFGATVDLAAPGGDTSVDRNGDSWADGVLSTIASDASGTLTYAYGFSQGTSMAAPHVAGVVALMRSVEPGLSPAQVDGLLEAGLLTEDLGAPGRDDFFGHGLVDAHAAVLAAGAAPPDPSAALTVTPSGLNFGVALLDAELDLANASSDPLTITQITNDSGGWLGVEALEIDAGGLGRYQVSVARGGLAAGTYAAGIDIVSSAGTTRVPVVMRVGGPMTSDAGFHFVALVDAETLAPLDEIGVAAVDGAYSFRFENVPAGDYLLIAGTDLDNDGFICDGGEACGSYPTLDVATPIHLDQDLENADFGTGFRQSIGAGVAESVAFPAVRY